MLHEKFLLLLDPQKNFHVLVYFFLSDKYTFSCAIHYISPFILTCRKPMDKFNFNASNCISL